MDPVTMVVAALAAGAGAGVKETAAAAVKDAYASLKALLGERFRGRTAANGALKELESSEHPEAAAAALTPYLREVGVDEPVLELARQLLSATGTSSYTINADRVQGLQQGNHNTQTNTFGE